MDGIDAIRIEFSSGAALAMNICIAFMMFGIALDLKVSDFRRVIEFPRSVLVGLSSQLLVLPLLTVALIKLWGPMPSMALGLILISVCPGGNISNFAVHLSKGNTALSVTLTSIVTLSAFLVTPVTFAFWSSLIPETRPILKAISVGPLDMLKIIVMLIVIPLLLGMFINYKFPKPTGIIRKPVKTLSVVLFAAFVFFAVFANRARIIEYLSIVFVLVVTHNIVSLLAGYYWAKFNGRNLRDRKAICMETGIQNAGLGLIIVLNFFGDYGGMLIVAAFWGVWNLVAAFTLAMFWNYRSGTVIESGSAY